MSEVRYPSNSLKSKEEQRISADKDIKKVVKGKVRIKKKSDAAKFKDVFISEDAANVKSYIFLDVLVPAIKEAVSHIVTDGINMILFGETGRSKKRSSIDKISYKSYYDSPRESRRYEESRGRSGFDYGNIVLDTRGEAEDVLDHMDAILDEYHVVSVADVYDLLGESCPLTYNKYGWTNLGSAEVVRVRDGYLLKLPRALAIK